MEFKIVGKRDKDRFIIQQKDTKGMCCCSKYTIGQLITMGHVVSGVSFEPHFHLIGEVKDYPNVPDTKRSAAVIARGLKAPKTAKTAIIKRKLQKSKCTAILSRIDIEASEYRCSETYTFSVLCASQSALTALRKLNRSLSQACSGFYIDDNAKRKIIRHGSYCKTIRIKDDLSLEPDVQVVCAQQVVVDYRNTYESSRAVISFRECNEFNPEITDSKGIDTSQPFHLGSTANGGSTPGGLANYFRMLGTL